MFQKNNQNSGYTGNNIKLLMQRGGLGKTGIKLFKGNTKTKKLQAKYSVITQLSLKCQGNRKTILKVHESREQFTHELFLGWMTFIQLGDNLENFGKINDDKHFIYF